MGFELLTLDRKSLLDVPYAKRRAGLEALDLNAPLWQTPETFDAGEALFEAVSTHEIEGVVAKRRSGRYEPGNRGWVEGEEPRLLALRAGA